MRSLAGYISTWVFGACVVWATSFPLPPGALAQQALGIPLTSPEIRAKLVGRTIKAISDWSAPYAVYVTPELSFQIVGSSTVLKHDLLDNGILCTSEPDNRFCFRVYLDGDDVELRFQTGKVYFTGRRVD